MGQVAGRVGMTAVGDLSDYMYKHAATDGERAAWEDGGSNKVLLHGIVGAGMAALGGGNAADGALGAAGGEAGINAMLKFLDEHEIPRNSAEAKTLMQLGSVAIGAALGGETGASTALVGDQFNRVLHPDYVRRLDTLADQFAAEQGISKEEARNRLIVQGYRVQDARYDDYLSSKKQPDDMAALAFLRNDGVVASASTGLNLSGTDAAERRNASLFANDLYHDPQAQAWFQQATGLSADYMKDLARNDYFGNQLPAYASTYADWQLRQDLRSMLGFTPLGGIASVGERTYRGDYSGAAKEAATQVAINVAVSGAVKVVGAAASVVKTAIAEGKATQGAVKETLQGIENVSSEAGNLTKKVEDSSVEVSSKASRNGGRGNPTAGKDGGADTVWNDIKPTQPSYSGSNIPKSFELQLPNGQKVWVHGNATEHIAEYAQYVANRGTPEALRLVTQQELRSLQAAVNSVTKEGVPYDRLIVVDGWELKFSRSRSNDGLPALIHALYIP